MMIAEEYLSRSWLFGRLKADPTDSLSSATRLVSLKSVSLAKVLGAASTWSVIS